MSYQKVIVSGNLSRDPEVRYTGGGAAVCNLSIPVSEHWKSKDGEKQELTEWISCVLWGKTAELAGEYLRKGSAVTIDGRMQTREYETKDGTKKQVTEVKVDNLKFMRGGASKPAEKPAAPAEESFDSDIPFN